MKMVMRKLSIKKYTYARITCKAERQMQNLLILCIVKSVVFSKSPIKSLKIKFKRKQLLVSGINPNNKEEGRILYGSVSRSKNSYTR